MAAAVLLGALGAGAVLLVVSGWSPSPPRPRRVVWPSQVRPERFLVPVAVAFVALVATRQPAAAAIGALAGHIAVQWREQRPDEAAQTAEAIALWTEGLRNAVGAADGVETVLADSARHAPARIRPDVQRMVSRLPYEPLDDVLALRTGTLAHPSADQVARALHQAANEGGSLRDVLDRLAKQARGLAEMHRRVETAREQPRSTMRTVTVVIAVFTGGLFVFAGEWMQAYGTIGGQLVLLAVAAWFALWHRQLRRMSHIQPIQRFYVSGGPDR